MNAIITGSSKGIGKAIAWGLLREGWNVALSSRNITDLAQVQRDAASSFPDQEILIHAVDFYDKMQTISYGRTILEHWQQIDLLVNNAGIFFPGEVHQEADGMLESTLALNVLSPYHLTRTIIPRMKDQQQGHVINICSVASLISYPNGGAYTISKFALLGFSKALREEMKTHGVKVTSIMPGATWSASWEGAPFPEERLMPAEDVAEVVLSTTRMSAASVVEDIVIRPQLGDL